MDKSFGHLEHVAPATVWQSEPSEFVPWLAAEENLRRLGLALRFNPELVARETHIGRFRADLLCRDRATGGAVVIEVQLGPSDHSHLGQLLTYAVRLPACAVWLATGFHKEHLEVVEKLNRVGGGAFRCFAVEMRLWKIAGSPVAPQFSVVAEPGDPAAAADGALAERIARADAARPHSRAACRPASNDNPIRVHRRRRNQSILSVAYRDGPAMGLARDAERHRGRAGPAARRADLKRRVARCRRRGCAGRAASSSTPIARRRRPCRRPAASAWKREP